MASISIVITTHNLENYLEECFEGLKQQSFQDFNVIIVDDASTDGTRNIIDKWCNNNPGKYQCIMVDDNLGAPGVVRNVALDSDLIDGEYVLFLDGDDTFEVNMLGRMYHEARLSENEWADIVVCAFDRIDEITGEIVSTELQGFPKLLNTSKNRRDDLAFVNTAPWNKLWRRRVIEDLRYSDFKVGEEVVFTLEAYRRSKKIIFIHDVLIHYRIRPGSAISCVDETTIYSFAKELFKVWSKESGDYKKMIELMIFLHIGLSMSLRAADNSWILLRDHIKITGQWFKENFGWFKENDFFKFRSLIRHRVKGIGVWSAYYMYRIHFFWLGLWMYKRLKINIKF